jgi:hypothetical protein
MAFEHIMHPHTKARVEGTASPPPKTADEITTFNDRIAVKITTAVGTMTCAYVFTVIALLSLPSILKQAGVGVGFDLGDGVVLIVSWIAQTFIQLVLLSIIIVGQNIQARSSDTRAESTYRDAEAVLHEALQIQAHLADQDKRLEDLITAATR